MSIKSMHHLAFAIFLLSTAILLVACGIYIYKQEGIVWLNIFVFFMALSNVSYSIKQGKEAYATRNDKDEDE